MRREGCAVRTVLFHGFTGGAGSFAHLRLDAVTPELPGHGDAPDATSWEACLDVLERLLDPTPVVLAGYSMGARIALALALRRPQRIARLVLESGTAGIEDPGDRAQRLRDDEGLAQLIEREGVPAFVERWEQHPSLETMRPFAAALRAERLRHRASGLASALRHLGAGAQPSYWDALARLDVNTVLLAGTRDDKFADLAQRMHERLPGAELRLVPNCGHAPHLEQPDAFLGALR
jgi:2-succinyl-6-hydroxy-2,4-cyclohexadiene-1-carboxylate synthase